MTPEQQARLEARIPQHIALVENRDPDPLGGNPDVNHLLEWFRNTRPQPAAATSTTSLNVRAPNDPKIRTKRTPRPTV